MLVVCDLLHSLVWHCFLNAHTKITIYTLICCQCLIACLWIKLLVCENCKALITVSWPWCYLKVLKLLRLRPLSFVDPASSIISFPYHLSISVSVFQLFLSSSSVYFLLWVPGKRLSSNTSSFFILKLLPLPGCSQNKLMHCVLFTVTYCIFVIWPNTSDFSNLALLYTIFSGPIKALHIPAKWSHWWFCHSILVPPQSPHWWCYHSILISPQAPHLLFCHSILVSPQASLYKRMPLVCHYFPLFCTICHFLWHKIILDSQVDTI